jgi:hypothetical protein
MKSRVLYAGEFMSGPVTPWLPKKPKELPAPGPTLRGWRRYYVTIDGFEFRFSALAELRHCADVLALKNLPPAHPNGHWLSRLPGWTKTWRYRQKAVKGPEKALALFLKDPGCGAAGQDPFEKRIDAWSRRAREDDIGAAAAKKKRLRAESAARRRKP